MLKKTKVEKVVAKTVAPKTEIKNTSVKASSQKSDISEKIKQIKEVAKVAITKVAGATAEAYEKAYKPATCADDSVENLRKFTASSLAKDFVKKNNGCWNHQLWLEFCATVTERGYTPINFDQVGLVLEKEKAAYFAGNK